MKVKCIATSLNEEQIKLCTERQLGHSWCSLVVGEIYPVFGLTASPHYYGGLSYEVEHGLGAEYIVGVPFCLFEIVDDRPSKYWKAKRISETTLALWPEEFYAEYFHDDLSNHFPEALENFRKLKKILESEHSDPGEPKWDEDLGA